jgi:PIN like domain
VTPRPAQVHFYIDADIRGLGIILGALRSDVTYPGDPGALVHKRQRPPCTIDARAMLDPDWIAEVAAQGWLIVTRDNRISENRNEIAAVREHSAKMAALNQADDRGVTIVTASTPPLRRPDHDQLGH